MVSSTAFNRFTPHTPSTRGLTFVLFSCNIPIWGIVFKRYTLHRRCRFEAQVHSKGCLGSNFHNDVCPQTLVRNFLFLYIWDLSDTQKQKQNFLRQLLPHGRHSRPDQHKGPAEISQAPIRCQARCHGPLLGTDRRCSSAGIWKPRRHLAVAVQVGLVNCCLEYNPAEFLRQPHLVHDALPYGYSLYQSHPADYT